MSNEGPVQAAVDAVKVRVDAAGEAVKAAANVVIPIPGDLLQEVTDVVTAQEIVVGNTLESVTDHVTAYAKKILDLLPKLAKVGTG